MTLFIGLLVLLVGVSVLLAVLIRRMDRNTLYDAEGEHENG